MVNLTHFLSLHPQIALSIIPLNLSSSTHTLHFCPFTDAIHLLSADQRPAAAHGASWLKSTNNFSPEQFVFHHTVILPSLWPCSNPHLSSILFSSSFRPPAVSPLPHPQTVLNRVDGTVCRLMHESVAYFWQIFSWCIKTQSTARKTAY